ncbi:phytoene dehydrogenase-like protein [Pseudonocardia antarctica]|uniref:Phytoene dehydrogenase-like protein n=2 Tax=Pseudonocardia alni TaxID=33907 RepID=A0A852W3G6_PSEA5|nr:NAD(P)/FAD-dependent oxidoreductase [Pseudonocardia antarctica]NYG00122.1 phytoene dehydrogenase-like protein [Pseudonocardia antarctica]
MTERVDAVVVGAGHNGLVAANLLADAGWDVLVCEAAEAPGGAVRSAEITAPGFVSDLASAFHPLGAASPVLRELDLGAHGLQWRHAPAVLAHPTPDGRCAVLHRSLDDTATALDDDHPGDGDAWRALVAQWDRIGDDVVAAALRPFPPVRPAARLLRTLGTGDALRLARMLVQPVARMAQEHFGGRAAPLLLAGNALHTDLGPDSAAGAAYGWLLAMLGQRVGFPVPAGGAGALTGALVARLTARGGRIDCGRPIRTVLVGPSGRASGVVDAAGRRVLARRAVLADVDAPRLYRDLVGEEHLPARFVADLARFDWDFSTVKLDWALDGPVPWTAPGARSAGTVHLGADVDGLRRYAADLTAGRLPGDPFLLFGQMTTADPTRSPPGTESAWAYTHVPRGLGWGRDEVLRWADRMQQVVEDHAPGFGSRVLARAVAGPADLQGRDGNLVDGAITAGTSAVHQQLVFRPVPGLGRADTPVPGLFLAGASAHPGGAVHGGPGANAARAALAASGATGVLYRGAVRFAHRRLYG